MKRVVVIDYGLSNLDSLARAVQECGGSPIVTERRDSVRDATQIILPGVGVFRQAMHNLRERGLDEALHEQVVGEGIPLLGICLGMQLLASVGCEGGDAPGLGLIDGEVKRLVPDGPSARIPHMGWNEVHFDPDHPGAAALFAGLRPGQDFYFVHSYHFVPARQRATIGRTPYCGGFTAAVGSGRLFGVQFHPEKSQKAGFRVLQNFLAM
jgi:imidazole glycerol-phosphate synthase subunit HisH